MKKTLIIILSIFTIFFISYNYSKAFNISDFSSILDKKVAELKTTEEQVQYLKSFADSLTAPKYTKSKNAKSYNDIREYTLNMLKHFESELQKEQSENNSKNQTSFNKTTSNKNTTTQKIFKSNLPHISDNFSNIDVQKVRDAILSWHNEERKNVGVNPYTYNLDLEGSATTWANEIVRLGKTGNFHARNSGDRKYNYNSILNWFSNLGIKFPASIKGATSFSETVGYGSYKCSKSDCTDDLITAIKKTWTGVIMKEKNESNQPHYRAATMKHFTQMGAGIAIDKSKNYYIVIHYGVDF